MGSQIKFSYGQKNLNYALLTGQSLTYRFVRKNSQWYIFCTTVRPDVPTQSRWLNGVMGIDLNPGMIGWAIADREGNLKAKGQIRVNLQEKSSEQTKATLGDAVKQLVDIASEYGCPIAVETLDFSLKKTSIKQQGVRYSRMLSNFAYSKFFEMLNSRAERTGIEVVLLNAAYSSLIGLGKFMAQYGLSSDTAAGFVLARRAYRKSERIPANLARLLPEDRSRQCIRDLGLPSNLFANISPKVLHHYRQRASAEPPRELRRHPKPIRYTLVTPFCWQRYQEITDNLVELLVQIVHRIGINAERRVDKELIEDFKRVSGKNGMLFRIAEASLEHPEEMVKDVVYPVVSKQTLQNLVKEFKSTGSTYREKVYTVMRASYLHHYRRMVPKILSVLEFRSNNNMHRPVISALELLKKYTGSPQHYYTPEDEVLIDGVLKSSWRDLIVEVDSDGQERVNRVNYEISVLQALRDKLRSKEIWVVGAKRYCNPEEDLPKDFEQSREVYYQALKQPLKAEAFISCLQQEMGEALTQLEQNISNNAQVRILRRDNGWISVSPFVAAPEPLNLGRVIN